MRASSSIPPRAASNQTHQGIPTSPGSEGITVVVTLCLCNGELLPYIDTEAHYLECKMLLINQEGKFCNSRHQLRGDLNFLSVIL